MIDLYVLDTTDERVVASLKWGLDVLCLSDPHNVLKMTQFIFNTYNKVYRRKYGDDAVMGFDELLEMGFEDGDFHGQKACRRYGLCWGKALVGSLRICDYDPDVIYPMEEVYGIKLKDVFAEHGLDDRYFYFHYGRYAIDADALALAGISRLALARVYKGFTEVSFLDNCSNSSVVVSEIDVEMMGYLRLMGYNCISIGEPKHYRGSMKTPMLMIYDAKP